MPGKKGMMVLIGSGEFSSTMVEVYKSILSERYRKPKAVFVDTPAGFQLNADEIAQKAAAYFNDHVNVPLSVASLKAAENPAIPEAGTAYSLIANADFIITGPGSPTYAVRQWKKTRIPEIFIHRIEAGGCLVTASAAALTMGRFTLPVYEIYKVGQDPHWIEGIDLLGRFGIDLAVMPHWNNAEGGTHDTRYCYMGKPRLDDLISLLPEEVGILGIDEHTACIIDFENDRVEIRGVGGITLKDRHQETRFDSGALFPLDVLRKFNPAGNRSSLRTSSENGIYAEREISDMPSSPAACTIDIQTQNESDSFKILVEALVELRDQYRREKKFEAADAIRKCLENANIRIEDSKTGATWHYSI